jgi:hypothetical protein
MTIIIQNPRLINIFVGSYPTDVGFSSTNAIANAGFACSLKHLESLHTFVLADS